MFSLALTNVQSALLMGLCGAAVGSFVALASLRLPGGEPVIWGRSRCSGCSALLTHKDLVPILSYALLRGRCRRCGAPIERRYPATEFAAVIIGVVASLVYPIGQAFAAALLGWWLLLLGILDAEHYWLPDALTHPLAALGLLFAALFGSPLLIDSLIGAAAGYALLRLVAAAYSRVRGREGLGGGDAKLFAASGAWLGWYNLPVVLMTAGIAGLVAALLLHPRSRSIGTEMLPFGAFLAGATWIAYVSSPLLAILTM